MTDEEKEAFYEIENDYELITDGFFEQFNIRYAQKYSKYLRILLDLVEKQQKEIEEYKKQKEEWFDLYNQRVSDIVKLEQEVEEQKEIIEDLQYAIISRDKEIENLKSIEEEHKKENGELRKELESANHIASVEFIEHNFISKEEYDKLKYEFDVLDKELERLEVIEYKYYELKKLLEEE